MMRTAPPCGTGTQRGHRHRSVSVDPQYPSPLSHMDHQTHRTIKQMTEERKMTDKEITTARDKMQTYVGFANHPATDRVRKQYYKGAAAAINDLLCSLGHGDAVADLIDALNDGTWPI